MGEWQIFYNSFDETFEGDDQKANFAVQKSSDMVILGHISPIGQPRVTLELKNSKKSFFCALGEKCLLVISSRNVTDKEKDMKMTDIFYRLRFSNNNERDQCHHTLMDSLNTDGTMPLVSHSEAFQQSAFDKRTESSSAIQYFQFYALLSQQQNMLQDYVRTSTYQQAILWNRTDFLNKVVLDVGAGSGILSYFAVQAGAKKVYAVEASNMAEHCQKMVNANNLAGRIIVISGKIEEISIPEPVDVIISEPMGYMLFNERMLESFIHARKFLRSDAATSASVTNHSSHDSIPPTSSGDTVKSVSMQSLHSDKCALAVMYPSVATLYVAPFTDEALFLETQAKGNFWYQEYFHGVNLTSLRESAMQEYFSQPVVDTFDMSICMAPALSYGVDFRTVQEKDLYEIHIPLHFCIAYSGLLHGLAFWFDVGFLGSEKTVWLTTAPTEPLTHWYQVRCLLPAPLLLQENDELEGNCTLRCNERQSYDVDIEVGIKGSSHRIRNSLDLKNPCFRYTGAPVNPNQSPVAPDDSKSPTELYYERLSQQGPGYGTENGEAADSIQQQIAYVPDYNNVVVLPSSGEMPGNSGSKAVPYSFSYQ